MSSIFSVESSDNLENAVLAVANSPLDSASAAYGLGLSNQEAGLAIAPTINDLSGPKAADTSNSGYLNSSDPLLTEFIENNSSSDRQTTAYTDDLTGMGEGEELLLHAGPSTASTSSVSDRLSFADDFNPTRRYAFKDDYSFSSHSIATVRLNLDSSAFDTYLQLVDAATGSVLAFDDDGGSGVNSQISFTAQAGQQYTVRATSYGAYETGSYSLTARTSVNNPPTSPINSLNRFSSIYGHGLVDAAAAVATATGQSRFNDVADIGGNQWNNDIINAPEVWNQGYTGEGITVAVIDSGVDIFHEDLRDNIWQNTGEVFGDGIDNDGNGFVDDRFGWNFGEGQNNYNILPGTEYDSQGHGTHVAGTIAAANNGRGMTGVAYNSNIMAVRMGDVNASGEFVNGGDLSQAIRYAVDNGADVINMSLGWGDPTGSVREALAYAASQDVIAVMAAGNTSESSPSPIASNAFDYGISVGAVTRTGAIASFSNRAGFDSQMQHVMAPGQQIYSTTPDDTWNYSQGTSMAAPHVAGVVALMLSANENLTHAQVREILTGTASLSATAATSTVPQYQTDDWQFRVPSVEYA